MVNRIVNFVRRLISQTENSCVSMERWQHSSRFLYWVRWEKEDSFSGESRVVMSACMPAWVDVWMCGWTNEEMPGLLCKHVSQQLHDKSMLIWTVFHLFDMRCSVCVWFESESSRLVDSRLLIGELQVEEKKGDYWTRRQVRLSKAQIKRLDHHWQRANAA